MVFDEKNTLSPLLIALWLVLACGLYISSIPFLGNIRIDAVALLIIFLGLYRPASLSLNLAFFAGLMQDLVALAPLGQHALGLTVVAFILHYLRDEARLLNRVMQWVLVLGCLILLKFLSSWITALSLGILPGLAAYGSALVTSLLWPLLLALAVRQPRVRRPAS